MVADKETVHKYYSPTLKPWFGDMGDGVHNGGPDDPRIGVIRVEVSQAAYAIVDEGMLGKNASFHEGDGRNVARINRLRKLEPEEIQKCRLFPSFPRGEIETNLRFIQGAKNKVSIMREHERNSACVPIVRP